MNLRKQLEELVKKLDRDIVLQVVFPCVEELQCYTDGEKEEIF